jgi:SAM-dependent methyltransferase
MLFLTRYEREQWYKLLEEIRNTNATPELIIPQISLHLQSAFCFYIGVMLTATGKGKAGLAWLSAGTLNEADGVFSNAFLLGFLERQGGNLIVPAPAFEDPRHFIHFASVPMMRESRARFLAHLSHTLPPSDQPLRLMDIGCGDGSLTAAMIKSITESAKVQDIAEVLLVDPSPAMLTLAKKTVTAAYPDITILTANTRIQDLSDHIDRRYDVAVSSLAYHHMPYEDKAIHLKRLKPWIDNFVLFELDANNDTPEYGSPDLSLSVYQSYGRIIDFIFSHDAPVDVAVSCVDRFLMAELVSILTEKRGVRTDYHMLSAQWHQLFRSVLEPEFTLRSDSYAYADEYVGLFTHHYAREFC